MTEAYPRRLRLMRGLTDLLKTITPANGYKSDLSDFENAAGDVRSRVFRGRNIFGKDDPLPMVAILENPKPDPAAQDTAPNSDVALGPLELLIQGFVKDDPNNPSDAAYVLMADVQQCLAKHRAWSKQSGRHDRNYFGVGPWVGDFKIGTGVVRPPDDVSAYACFWLILILTIGEDFSAPYS